MKMLQARFGTDTLAIIAGSLRICDVLAVLVGGYLAYYLRASSMFMPGLYLLALVVAAILTFNLFHLAGCYRPAQQTSGAKQITRAASAWLAVILIMVALSYMTKTSAIFSRLWLGYWVILTLGGLIVPRVALALYFVKARKSGIGLLHILILGHGPVAARVLERLGRDGQENTVVIGCLACGSESRAVREEMFLGSLEDFNQIMTTHKVDEILIAVPWTEAGLVQTVLSQLRGRALDVRFALPLPPASIPVLGVSLSSGVPLLQLSARPLAAWDRILKGLEDRVLAFLLIIFLAPLMAVLALAIKLESKGPALFRQARAGFNREQFTVLKFRTMYTGSEDGDTVPQARPGDPRVTRLGRWLRKTSLDELPQLFNVLFGDMSLVGPRPHAVAHDHLYADLIDDYLGRLRVKPGITGLAQIKGLRGATSTPEQMARRVEHDLYYIENWSIYLDFKILLLTLFLGFMNENAY